MGMASFENAHLDERSLYLRREGHEIKLKFIIPRQASKHQHRLKEKIEKEEIQNQEAREIEEKGKGEKIKMIEKEVEKQGV